MKNLTKEQQAELKSIVSGENLTYEEFLKLEKESEKTEKGGFHALLYNIPMEFKGKIQSKKNGKICFERVFIEAMYPDSEFYEDKEDHVWMSEKGFEKYKVGDSLSFMAEVYRYIKTGKGKQLDYGLRNPSYIKKIDNYKLPTNKEMQNQMMNSIMCEVCYLNEHCNKNFCILKSSKKKNKSKKIEDNKKPKNINTKNGNKEV